MLDMLRPIGKVPGLKLHPYYFWVPGGLLKRRKHTMTSDLEFNVDAGDLDHVIRQRLAYSHTPGDILQLYETFVVPSGSLLQLAQQLRQLVPALDIRLRALAPTKIMILWDGGVFTCSIQRDARADLAIKGVVDIHLCSTPDIVCRVMADLHQAYDPYREAQLKLWYLDANHGPSKHELRLKPHGKFMPAFYPWVEPGFFDRYMASSASILFMAGPPGTGKTSVLRHEIVARKLTVAATYDERMMANDQMFLNFITGSSEMMVLEDADNLVRSRERGDNPLIARLLSFSDGLPKFPNKKIVFTTNLDDFSMVDPALTRPGRCYGALHARALTYDEALVACRVAGLTVPTPHKSHYTIAEIFNQDSGPAVDIARPRPGFRTRS